MKSHPYVENEFVYFNDNMIVQRFVDITWSRRGKKHYVSRGYHYTKMRDIFTVDVRDLSNGSGVKVVGVCPICKYTRELKFSHITVYKHTKCRGCAIIKDLTGGIFNRLTVIALLSIKNGGDARYLCKCQCGEIIEVIGKNLRAGNTQSCGCLHRERMSERMTGDKHPMWNPELTNIDRKKRRSADVKQWAKDVKVRDNFICQTCGEYGGELHSHHLNNYTDYRNQDSDLNNGVTLCKMCHIGFHSWMGNNRIECTFDDFVEFCEENYPQALLLSCHT